MGVFVLQTACKVLTTLGSAFLAAARDLILNQTVPVLTCLIKVFRNKILKNPKYQQMKPILNTPITVSACNVKAKKLQCKKLSFHFVTSKLNRKLAPTAMCGGQTYPCGSSLALNILY